MSRLALALLVVLVFSACASPPTTSPVSPALPAPKVTVSPAAPPSTSPSPRTATPLRGPSPTPSTTPKPSAKPTPKTSPSPSATTPASPTVPLVSERATVFVDPGKTSLLTLRLEYGEKADVKVSVVSGDITLVVRDPYGRNILEAPRVAAKNFTITPAVDGGFQFVFLIDSSEEMYNRIVFVDVQHRGPAQFPRFEGESFALNARGSSTYTMSLYPEQGVKGSFRVRGGQDDISFSVRSPDGTMLVPSTRAWASHDFAISGGVGGDFTLTLDNSASLYMGKVVSLSLSTNPGGVWQPWWGTPTKLVFTAVPVAPAPGSPFTTQPVVTVLDGAGKVASTSSAPVTLALSPATGSSGAMLSGNMTVNAVNGVATFTGLSIDRPGTGYILTATSPGLFPTASGAFRVSSNADPLLPKYTLEVVVMPAGGGTVTMSPDDHAHASGTKVTLRAAPAQGYYFAGWGGSLLGTISPMEIIVDSNKRVTASFVRQNW